MRRSLSLLLSLSLLAAVSCRRAETPAGTATHADSASAPPSKKAAAAAPQRPGTDVGAAMPAYGAQWLDGQKFDLTSEKGKVILLNAWATWCGPCRLEIPELNRLHAKYAKQNFTVIGVSVDDAGADAVKPFLQDEKISYPIALDPDGRIVTLLDTQVIPTSVLVDRKGTIVWRQVGAIDQNDAKLQKALTAALAQ